jgi:hypothetical protein
MRNIRIIIVLAFVSALAALGCGGNGASNNDQGISVSFLGLFQSTTSQNTGGGGGGGNNQNNLTGCGQLPQPLAAGYISVGQTFLTPTTTPQPGTEGLSVDPSGAVYAIVGIQNNMFGQVYRADRVLLEYYVPGSKIQPPSTNVAVSLLAGPAESGLGTSGQDTPSLRRPNITSLPPTFSQVCNRAFAQVPIIPAPVREWLIFNSNLLPEAPYDLEVVVSLTGLSSGGNRYDTNQGLFTISVIPEIDIVPPTPSASASSTSTTDSQTSNETSNSTDTSTLSVRDQGENGSDAQGLDELERAFDAESVVEGH